ncbi:hypothetical protein [Saccharomonospora sp.]|uniref:hypothetical protein n=1 Tax=Saccharomonospora sp. TaxID=33913 RepID=UPI002604CEDF|nr:hypothetical protein [Saccharomonospora sp.]
MCRESAESGESVSRSLDTLIVDHAHSSGSALDEWTAEELDTTWSVNVRVTSLLVRAFAEQYRRGGSFPSGWHWNTPAEAAAVVSLLLGEDASTITGNVVDAEAGFRRWSL